MSIHIRLSRLRRECGLTQEQAAEKMGVTRQTISGYETGRTRPDVEMMTRLAQLYGADLEQLLLGDERAKRDGRWLRNAAVGAGSLIVILACIASAVLLYTNRVFPVAEGQLSQAQLELFARRTQLLEIWQVLDRGTLVAATAAFLLLLALLLTGKARLDRRAALTYMGLLSAVLLGTGMIFGLADPLFPVVNYVITPCLVIGRMFAIFLISAAAERLKALRK